MLYTESSSASKSIYQLSIQMNMQGYIPTQKCLSECLGIYSPLQYKYCPGTKENS